MTFVPFDSRLCGRLCQSSEGDESHVGSLYCWASGHVLSYLHPLRQDSSKKPIPGYNVWTTQRRTGNCYHFIKLKNPYLLIDTEIKTETEISNFIKVDVQPWLGDMSSNFGRNLYPQTSFIYKWGQAGIRAGRQQQGRVYQLACFKLIILSKH